MYAVFELGTTPNWLQLRLLSYNPSIVINEKGNKVKALLPEYLMNLKTDYALHNNSLPF